ncbi:hypothetical protein C0989_005570 [Termitomyces sp. Mn162]|nr:hypothetical protein C0989_005570 [Termitomyces sp. Mn162]
MEATELARWTRFAAKGGIGKCTALVDCVAENPDDLMFLKGDEITVLMQLCESPGVYLVSFFHLRVYLTTHTGLKKPIITKRSSINANGNSGARKSPTPAGNRTRISIEEHIAATLVLPPSSSEMTKLRFSLRSSSRNSAGPERSDGEYGSSRDTSPAIPSTLSPALRGTPPSMYAASPPPPPASYASPKPPIRSSISSRHTSVLSSYSQTTDEGPGFANTHINSVPHADPDSKTRQPMSSPPTTTISSSSPTTTKTIAQPTHPTLPPSISSLSNSSLYASSSGTSVTAPTTTPSTSTPSTSTTITSPPPTASTNPDTSTPSHFHTSRLSLASDDGEVGIGLSLLQNLVDGDGWSGSESESDGLGTRRKASMRRKGSAQRKVSVRRHSAGRSSVISERSVYSSEDGLNYADTETGHSMHSPPPPVNPSQQELDDDLLQTQAAFSQHLDDDDIESPILGHNENRNTINQQMILTFPPVAPLSPSPSRSTSVSKDESYPSTYEFPTPPTHTHRISLSQASMASMSVNSRPTSFARPPRLPESTTTSANVNTRPSTAQSSQSHASSNWDGDIYDDYRYSRISSGTRSLSSRVSVGSRVNGSSSSVSGSAVGEWPPERMERPSIDGASLISESTGTASVRGSVDQQGQVQGRRTRSRSNTTASLNPVVLSPAIPETTPALGQTRSPPLPQAPLTHSPASSIHQQSSPHSRQLETTRVLGAGHRPTDSESEGSVSCAQEYRRNGTFSVPPLTSMTFGTVKSSSPESNPSPNINIRTSTTSTRPSALTLTSSNYTSSTLSALQSPLSLSHQHHRKNSTPSPLLHTGWGSAVSSPASTGQYAALPVTLPDLITTTNTTPSRSPTGLSAYIPLEKVAVEHEVEVQVTVGQESGKTERIMIGKDGKVARGFGEEQKWTEDKDREAERDEEEASEDTTFVIDNGVLHESPSMASSPETEPDVISKRRAASLLVANRMTSPVVDDSQNDDTEELEREKEKVRKEATSVVSTTPAPAALRDTTPSPSGLPSSPVTVVVTLPPPPPTSPALTPSRLRPPKLSDIRPSGERQSLFLPHPNAPKATPNSISPGPMYITSQTQPSSPPQLNAQRVRGSAIQAIHMALGGHGPPLGPRGRGPTIYGVATVDLSAAMGPIPIQFTVTPPLATAPPPGSVPPPSVPRAAATPATPPIRVMPPSTGAPVPRLAVRKTGSVSSPDVTPTVDGNAVPDVERPGSGTGGVIPRANFFPKAGGVRPRSRSFSGFQSSSVPLPLQRSRDMGDQPAQIPSASDIKRSLSPIVGSPSTPIASTKPGCRPSPLREYSPAPRPPNSPLIQSFAAPFNGQISSSVPPSPTTSQPHVLRQTASRSTLNEAPMPRPVPHIRSTFDGSGQSPSPSVQLTPEFRGRLSAENDAVSLHSSKSNMTLPPPAVIGRQSSLRSKLSLPNLRRNTPKQDESSNVQPMSPKTEGFLQVQDMDFQLVRPTFGNLHDERSSEDSGVMGRDMSVDVRQDGSLLRTDSPASRSAAYLSDTSSSILQGSKSSVRGGTDSEASTTSMTNAHNRRELKWMTVVGSVQPSQSRKSKKVKKLIFDGVPSSVRYLVWSMLTDGKARIVPGVYGQLGSREKVAALADIERDVQRCFAHQPQLQSTQGPVISLLQAYLTMVPDVQYMTGLTLIAGNLLIHAPEEDAFWIFVSLMDLHIRPYFSSTSAQVDVDATLFGRSLDNVDPMVAKKLFGELNISPLSICRPWFTSLFVGYLPPDYLDRVWDIFLFEGVPFLFRVALVLVSCSRQRISDTRSADAALNTVLYPSPELLPTSPEALITLALAAKIKDDDLQKQRVKLEAQAKRQTFAPRTVSTPHTISLPRP